MYNYDYFDFGCSNGNAMQYFKDVMPALRGLGIDIDQIKIDAARSRGFDAVNYNINQLPKEKLVKFVSMSHFLEHLPSVTEAEKFIKKGIEISTDFVLIRQPWFDSDGYLLSKNLKLYWSDWSGHPNKMTSFDFFLILSKELEKKNILGFSIFGKGPIINSSSNALIPINSATDQHQFNETLHGEKIHDLIFDIPIYTEIIVTIKINDKAEIEKFLNPLGSLSHLISRSIN